MCIRDRPDTEKSIYLTFDEGYENGYTEKILYTLKEKQCSAVFFVTMPYVQQNPDLIRRMIDEGHVVGNHSVQHKSMPTLSMEDAATEIICLLYTSQYGVRLPQQTFQIQS